MSVSLERYIDMWGDEDGEKWMANGHHDRASMIKHAITYEFDCGGEDVDESAFGRLDHIWIIWDSEDEEAPGQKASEGDHGAEALSVLYRHNGSEPYAAPADGKPT